MTWDGSVKQFQEIKEMLHGNAILYKDKILIITSANDKVVVVEIKKGETINEPYHFSL